MRNLLIIIIILTSLFSLPTLAQNDSPASQALATQTDIGHVAVPVASEKALSYYNTRNFWWGFGIIWSIFIPALFLFTGWSAKIRDVAQRMGKKWFFTIGIYAVIFTVVTFFIDLPLGYFSDYAMEHSFGLSNQTLAKWLQDNFISLAISCVMSFLFLWIPYLLLKKSPQRWWLYTSLLAIPFIFLMILVQPLWIDPLFNKFGPMKDKALESKILALAEKSGIAGSRVFEVAKSEDTKKVNAYVTGFMDTKRIVLWDTLTAKLDEKETLFVMGHEMGHYVLGHVWKSIAFISLIILVMLYLAHRLAHSLIAKYKHRFGFSELSDIASLPLLILITGILGFIAAPLMNTYTRYNEHEADRFGLEVTKNNRAAATAFVKLQQENLANPRPGWFVRLWRGSHPSLAERIEFSNSYRPWEKGETLKYGELFKQM
jgi:Zn-dependent protease with chaperone function